MVRKMIRNILYFIRFLLAADMYERIMEDLEDGKDIYG